LVAAELLATNQLAELLAVTQHLALLHPMEVVVEVLIAEQPLV
jgi:hypothetical protein